MRGSGLTSRSVVASAFALMLLLLLLTTTASAQDAAAVGDLRVDDSAASKSLGEVSPDVPAAEGTGGEIVDLDLQPPFVDVGSAVWEVTFDREVRWQYTTLLGVIIASTGNDLYGVDGLTGRRLWHHPVRLDQQAVQEVARTNVLLLLDVKPPKEKWEDADPEPAEAQQDAEGFTAGHYAMAIDQLNGEVLWTASQAIEEDPILVYPMYDRRQAFIVAINRDFMTNLGKAAAKKVGNILSLGIYQGKNAPTGHSYAFDLVDGKDAWRRKVVDPENLKFEISGDDILELRPKNVVDISAETGDDLWKLDIEDKSVEVVDGKLIIAEGKISAYDLSFDKKKDLKKGMLWKSKPSKTVGKINKVEAHESKLFFAGNKGFACLDSETGEMIWEASKDGKGVPMKIDVSPKGQLALGVVERTYGIPGFKVQDGGTVRLLVLDANDGTELGEFPADGDEANYIATGEIEAIKWLDETTIFLESRTRQMAVQLRNGTFETIWERDRPEKFEFPEDVDARIKARNTQLALAGATLAAGLIGAGSIGSDFGAMIVVAGSAAVAAALIATANSAEVYGASDFEDPSSRIAYERFKKRRELFDQLKKLEVVQAADGNGYEVEELNLLTGEVVKRGKVPTRGRAHVDTMFRLVYQKDYDKPNTLRAYVVEGYSAELVDEFSM